jgi:hypothetical protein
MIDDGFFVDGNFKGKFMYNFRPDLELLRKMQSQALRQKSNLRPCDSGAAL